MNVIKLDYTLTTTEERLELVNKILETTPKENLNEKYLEILADYLVIPIERKERKEHVYLTNNRMDTVSTNETSFEGLVSQLENGEDGIYNLIDRERGKQTILKPKVKITEKDVAEIPPLAQLVKDIAVLEKKLKSMQAIPEKTDEDNRKISILKKQLIDLRKDQYVIKNDYRQPITFNKLVHSTHITYLDDSYTLDENNYVVPEGISLCDPKVVEAILCNYSKIKQDGLDSLDSDMWYLMEDFDKVCGQALEKYPLYERLVQDKIDNMSNANIQEDLFQKFGVRHSIEYISSLWRKKIPALIASAAEDNVLSWHFLTKEKGTYKRCSRCGQIKLAHNKYFSKNKTSKDGWYSICKECRNRKDK